MMGKMPVLILCVFLSSLVVSPGVNAQFAGMDSLTVALATIANTPSKELIVPLGEEVHDRQNHQAVNYIKPYINLDEYKGKLIILDFWDQWCYGCIKLMPALERLQKEFKNDIIILPVTTQSKNSILAFYKKMRRGGRPVALPSIVEDTIFHKMFPPVGYPFDVWISQEGKVLALVTGNYVTSDNIKKALTGQDLHFPDYTRLYEFDRDKPVSLDISPGFDTNMISRSLFMKELLGVNGHGSLITRYKDWGRLFITNCDMVEMYKRIYAMSDPSFLAVYPNYDSPWLIVKKYIGQYTIKDWDTIDSINTFDRRFCYELMLPDTNEGQMTLKRRAIEDLDQFFQYKSSFETVAIPCLVLYQLDGQATQDDRPLKKDEFFATGEQLCRILNGRLAFNIHYPYIVNSITPEKQIRFSLMMNSRVSLREIQEQLKKYRLDVKMETKCLRVLLLKKMNTF